MNWLNRQQFNKLIPLPRSLTTLDFVMAYLVQAIDDLPGIIGLSRMSELQAWLAGEGNQYGGADWDALDPAPAPLALYRLIVPYLVYSSFAQYVLFGDTSITVSGLVEKNDDEDSKALGDQRRTELYRNQQRMADRAALKIRDYLATNQTSCATADQQVTAPRISTVSGRTKSLF